MMTNSVRAQARVFDILAILVAIIALAFRLQLDGVTVSPDSQLYLLLAQNLTRNGCFSESNPVTALCVPSWGGQPPGYPVFVALVGLLFGWEPMKIIVSQSVVFACALCYLLICAARLHINRALLIVAGLVVALSPGVSGTSRWLLTEHLAAAAALWVLAECCRAMAKRTMPTVAMSLAVMAAMLMRWDMIWIVALPLGVTWSLHSSHEALSRSVQIVGMSFAPYALLSLRAWAIGLSLIPPATRAVNDGLPPGFLHFFRTAAISERATKTFFWNVWDQKYSNISRREDWNAFLPLQAPSEFDAAFEGLASEKDGGPISATVDGRFESEARRLERDGGLKYRASVLFMRAYNMWTARESIFGWFYGDTMAGADFLRRAADKERLVLLALVALSLLLTRDSVVRSLLIGLLTVAFLRTVFLVSATALEIRYLVPMISMMEFCAVAWWLSPRTRRTDLPLTES